MANQIVTINVSQTIAPTPSTLQGTGAFVTQGGTTNAVNSLTLVTSLSALTAMLAGSKTIASITWSGSVATVTTSAAHGWTVSDVVTMTIAGATPAGYNGTFQATITGTTTFTYPLTPNPGSETVPGTATLGAVAELQAMGTTFFAQNGSLSCYVLELGEAPAATGVTNLGTWIAANPNTVYLYLVPTEFTAATGFSALVGNYEALNAKTYFFVTMTNANYTGFTAAMKSVLGLIEAPLTPATEFSLAADFFSILNQNPSSTHQATENAFAYQYGVTPYPPAGNAALLATYKAANVNVIGTGAEGGISTACLFWGTTMDGKDFSFWYSVDWTQINVALALANTVINGSNNPQNPLKYNQPGINRLQASAAQTMASAISYGLALGSLVQTQLPQAVFLQNEANGVYNGQVVVNAEPFTYYTAENPNDYGIGKYGGISIAYSPLNGFRAIIVGLNVSDFA